MEQTARATLQLRQEDFGERLSIEVERHFTWLQSVRDTADAGELFEIANDDPPEEGVSFSQSTKSTVSTFAFSLSTDVTPKNIP